MTFVTSVWRKTASALAHGFLRAKTLLVGVDEASLPPATTGLRRAVRKVIVTIVGGSVTAVGLALIVLPGPAIVVIPLGLAILGTEFSWARKLLLPIRKFFRRRALPPQQ